VKRLAYKFTLWKDLGKKGVHEQTIVVTQDSGILALRLIRKGPPSHPNFFMIRMKKVKFIPASCKPNLIFFSHEEGYLFFLPPFPDLDVETFAVDAGSCFLVLPGCLGTSSATWNISCFPAIRSKFQIHYI